MNICGDIGNFVLTTGIIDTGNLIFPDVNDTGDKLSPVPM
jgi:hypothetical protein